MRLLILHQFFYPDHSAVSQLMTELAESLTSRKVEVTAIAGRGGYNGGEKLPPAEDYQGIKIVRAWTTSYGKKSLFGRAADYLTFYVGASWKLLRVPRQDIILALSHPPLIGLLALVVGRLRGSRVVALVQDVHPDLAIALGQVGKGNPAARLLNWLNSVGLRGANRIIVLGDCMRERIAAKIDPREVSRIDVIHNWADGRQIKPLNGDTNPFATQHKLEDKFVVLFSGNFGYVNEFSTVLKAARRLRDNRNVVFLFIGDGVKGNEIRSFSADHQLTNISLLPYQPREMLNYSLGSGDALLTTLVDGLAGLSVPSKTYSSLAAGRPILFVGDRRSDAARLVAENNCGAVVAAGDDEALATIIQSWADDKERMRAMGKAARSLFEARFDRERAVNAYLETFAKCMNGAGNAL